MTRINPLRSVLAAACLATLPVTLALAAVTAEEAAKLKTELTPLGAEKAGNKDGSIPAWSGGFTTPIAGDRPRPAATSRMRSARPVGFRPPAFDTMRTPRSSASPRHCSIWVTNVRA